MIKDYTNFKDTVFSRKTTDSEERKYNYDIGIT